jgi:Ca2+-binding RTX toxin-like protein
VSLNLATGTACDGAGSDTLANIEHVIGSAANNVVEGGAGNNAIDGGLSTDTASYPRAAADVSVTLATPGAQQNRLRAGFGWLTGIDNLTGSAYNDALAGDAATNGLVGGMGDDNLNEAVGNDLLSRAGRADVLSEGLGTDPFHCNRLAGTDTIIDFVSGTEKLRFSQAAIRIGDGETGVEGATVIGAPGGFAPTSELVICTRDIVGAITANSAAAAIGAATAAYASGATRCSPRTTGPDLTRTDSE